MVRTRAIWPRAGVAVACLGIALLSGLLFGCKGQGASSARGTAGKDSGSPIAVSVTNPQPQTVQGEITYNGTLHAEDEVQVVAETSGKVTALLVQVGTRVDKGDVLAQIDDELKKAAFETAEAAYEKSKADWARGVDLYAQKVISDVERQGLKLALASANSSYVNAKKDLENAKVRAPQAGVVTKTSVSVGSMLSPGAPVAYLVDTSNLKITIQVGERDILKIKSGMRVAVDSDLYPDAPFSGVVSGVSPKGDSALSFPVEIKLHTAPSRPLYDGMSAKARINLGSRTILAIPRASIVGSYQLPQVFVVRDGAAKLVDVKTGGEYGTSLEVLGGLDKSDEVVVDGQNNLFDGALVTVSGRS